MPQSWCYFGVFNTCSPGCGVLKTNWELHEFVLPDSTACINSDGLNVYTGFYLDQEPVFLVEKHLCSVEGSLEDQAARVMGEILPDSFAIMLNKKNLMVYGATLQPPLWAFSSTSIDIAEMMQFLMLKIKIF